MGFGTLNPALRDIPGYHGMDAMNASHPSYALGPAVWVLLFFFPADLVTSSCEVTKISIMEVTKGQAGRRVCGTIEVVVGAMIGSGAIVNAMNGFVDIFSFLGAALTILTGSLGIGASTVKWIIAYMVAGIISVLYLGFVTIGGFFVIVNYGDYSDSISSYGIQDVSSFRKTFLLVVFIFVLGFIASILGVCFAFTSLCARKQRQDSFRFQRFNEPAGAVESPPDYNYSNTGFVNLAQTQQNDYGNKPVGGGEAPPTYNNDTAAADTKQGMV